MIGGLLKSSSRLALIAAAGVVAGGIAAQAADLGGNCCADLEERVAELEATTARKGTRKMGLQINGQISEAVIYWDDKGEKNTYIAENNGTQNRFTAQGSSKINSDWSAGFRMEWQVRAFRSSGLDQLARGDNEKQTSTVYNTRSLALKHAHWYLDSKSMGRFTVGQQSDSISGILSINLAEPDGFSGVDAGYANRDFRLRRDNGVKGNGSLSALTWRDAFFRNGDGPVSPDYTRATTVRYQTPTFFGFNVSATYGEDDMWSAGLRYAGDLGPFRVAAGVGYMETRDDDRNHCSNLDNNPAAPTITNVSCNFVEAGGSIMHTPTGLYVTGGWARITDDFRRQRATLSGVSAAAAVDNTDAYWYVQAGWEAKLNSLGKTTFWGDYQTWESGFGMRDNNVSTVAAGDQLNSFAAGAAFISSGKTESWGFGVTQEIEAASMRLYAGYRTYSTDIILLQGTTLRATNPVADMQVLYTGATVKF